jgi:hypothetical protein
METTPCAIAGSIDAVTKLSQENKDRKRDLNLNRIVFTNPLVDIAREDTTLAERSL